MTSKALQSLASRIEQEPKNLLPKMRKALIGSLLVLSPTAFSQSLSSTSRIEINMSEASREALRSDHKTRVQDGVTGAYLSEAFSTKPLAIAIESRGQSSIAFARKNYAVKSLDGHDLTKTILTAGSMDPLNIKNQIMYSLYKKVGVPSFENRLSELFLNGESQGLYMITEAPEHVILAKEHEGVEIVLRRRYNDVIELKKAKKSLSEDEINKYIKALSDLHLQASQKKGQVLLDFLSSRLNLDSYFRMLGINYIAKNGDSADEVFFAGAKDEQGNIKFVAVPWDLDDSFANEMHQANIPLSANAGREELSHAVKIFGFESHLDRAITSDPIVLKAYFKELQKMIGPLKASLTNIVNQVGNNIEPYLEIPAVLEAGRFDKGKEAYTREGIRAELQKNLNLLQSQTSALDQELPEAINETEGRAHKMSAFRNWFADNILKIAGHIAEKQKATGEDKH